MRVFVAVELGPEEIAAAERAITALKEQTRARAPAVRITWVRGSGLHLTLHFLGELHARDFQRAVAVFAAPLPIRGFDVAFGGLGVFPPRGAPRVVWAGFSGPAVERLQDLHRVVGDRLRAAGLPSDDKPFRPHVTLGRIRDAAGLRARDLLTGADAAALGTVHVGRVTLFESRLRPEGAEHVEAATTELE